MREQERAQEVPGIIRARKFELVDEHGKVRAAIEIHRGLTGIVLVGLDGKHRVGLWLNADGQPSIGLRDSSGRMAFMMALGHNEARMLTMADKDGHVRLALSVAPDGAPEIHLISGENELGRFTPAGFQSAGPSEARERGQSEEEPRGAGPEEEAA
jgi:hypothetical protein